MIHYLVHILLAHQILRTQMFHVISPDTDLWREMSRSDHPMGALAKSHVIIQIDVH